MNVTWRGEDGAPDFIVVTSPVTGEPFTLYAGKTADVPEDLAIGRLLGNPFFDIEKPKDAKLNAKSAEVKGLEEEVSRAQNDLDKAKAVQKGAKSDGDKAAAQAQVDAAQRALDEARAKLDEAKK